MKTRLTQALVISVLLSTTGCALDIPFWNNEDETEQTTTPESIITPVFSSNIEPNPNNNVCEAQCAKYGGLKKKFCKKKCESKLKKQKQ